MRGRPGKGGRRRKGPSAEQRQGNAAFAYVMKTWGALTDEEYLAWHVAAKNRRTHGINYFKQVNLRRVRRGEELARVPPQPKPYDAGPVLKRLIIRNRGGGRLTFELEFRRAPTAPMTVWGARPCSRGVTKPDKCPRLGWLPALEDGVCDITALYFTKHGPYIQEHDVELTGKRIFIRIRQETDDGANLYEEVSAVVPEPEGRARRQKRPNPVVTPS